MKEILNENLLELYEPIIKNYIYKELPINIFVSNKDGYIVWGNSRVIGTLNETKETFMGKHLSTWGDENWNNCKKVIETGHEYTEEEIGLDNHIYLTTRKPIPVENGCDIAGVIGLSLDITDRKQAEMTKCEFLMNMGHELRTPFCGIITVLELLYGKEEDLKKKSLLEMSLYSSKRLLKFMNDIQEVSRLGHLPLDEELCNMKEMLANIILFLMPTTEMKKLEIEASCTGKETMINRYRIEKILLNLMGNAVKFTEQGTITVSIKISSMLTIVVSDTGIGIDKKHHEKIFENFFKVVASYKKDEYAGIGKGLYLVKRYTEELQGSISVQSALGKGSVFTVMIPTRR
ncbi:Two component system histidine kinase [Candidatus Rickettsiella viridis]|uniref:histidine kinase n=1 Tax=Candidatus Rickettsiella viridis TaxID=676208 RepID=A0A2Z5V6Z7_9COXI|nr:PAS domain-containing sensor histidine kinase [Candidatus Rickettsiella viridis]BBB14947.1 Two component system histidine kinase [Candidatus Rickettsiella viridis]